MQHWPVDEFAAYAPLEEPAATVARQYAVVLSAWRVAAHDASQSQCLGLGYGLATRRRVMSRGRGDRSRWRSGRGHRYLLGGTSTRHAERQRPVPHRITRIRVCSKHSAWPDISVVMFIQGEYTTRRGREQGTNNQGRRGCGVYAPLIQYYYYITTCQMVPMVKYYKNLVQYIYYEQTNLRKYHTFILHIISIV